MRRVENRDKHHINGLSYWVLRGLECPVYLPPDITTRPATYVFLDLQNVQVQLTRSSSCRSDASELCFCLPRPNIFHHHNYGRRNAYFSLPGHLGSQDG